MKQLSAALILVFVVALAATGGCGTNDDDVGDDDVTGGGVCPAPGTPGGPSGGCEVVVGSVEECPAIQDVCRPDICGGYDCCYCDPRGFWGTLIIDCFEGCQGMDGPQPDGCGSFDAGVAAHC